MEDKRILELLWQRSEAAISAMVRQYGHRLYATAINLVNDPQDAEECVSDTYLAIWNAIPPKRPESLTAYIYRAGRNIALNRLRANTAEKRGSYQLSLDELSECIPAPCSQDGSILGQAMDAYLSSIPKQSRIIFVRRYWFGDSVKDIARDMSMTENAVSARLSRSKAGLKEYLSKEGLL